MGVKPRITVDEARGHDLTNPLLFEFRTAGDVLEMVRGLYERIYVNYGNNLVPVEQVRRINIADAARLGLVELYDREMHRLDIIYASRANYIAVPHDIADVVRKPSETVRIVRLCTKHNRAVEAFLRELASYERVSLEQACKLAKAVLARLYPEGIAKELAKDLTPSTLRRRLLEPMNTLAPGLFSIREGEVIVGEVGDALARPYSLAEMYKLIVDTYEELRREPGSMYIPLIRVYSELVRKRAVSPKLLSFEGFVKICEEVSKRYPWVRVTVHPGLPKRDGTWMWIA